MSLSQVEPLYRDEESDSIISEVNAGYQLKQAPSTDWDISVVHHLACLIEVNAGHQLKQAPSTACVISHQRTVDHFLMGLLELFTDLLIAGQYASAMYSGNMPPPCSVANFSLRYLFINKIGTSYIETIRHHNNTIYGFQETIAVPGMLNDETTK
ncbi:3286_t:CDS:2 [Acaulospora colombiana]|uniref:3286_t:CDS:1 n=1 Tax=Acaulospora colombiana TaxID=27376 RepID=A0ACA9NH53_9GLOM|nr:3286_t:CDS:2 [Acaulospora colombiana]